MSDLTKSGIKIFNAHAKLGTRPLTAEELAEFLGTPELLVRLVELMRKENQMISVLHGITLIVQKTGCILEQTKNFRK